MPAKGLHPSEETRRRMSEATRAAMRSPEARAKISAALKGRSLGDETRRRLSEAMRGRRLSDEHRAKISATWTPERRGLLAAAKRTHGMHYSPEYRIWSAMIGRCHRPSHESFELYGGRGILVCAEWRVRGGFAAFYAHIGPKPGPEYSIDRIDNDLGYQPGNVRWATAKEQRANQRPRRRAE